MTWCHSVGTFGSIAKGEQKDGKPHSRCWVIPKWRGLLEFHTDHLLHQSLTRLSRSTSLVDIVAKRRGNQVGMSALPINRTKSSLLIPTLNEHFVGSATCVVDP